MIATQCSGCGYRFGVADDVAGLTAECPHCGQEVEVPSLRHVEVPLDPRPAPPVRERTVIADPLEVAPLAAPDPATAEQALQDALRGRLRLLDVIAPPTCSFAQDVLRSPRIVLAGGNAHVWVGFLVADAALLIAVFFLASARSMWGISDMGRALGLCLCAAAIGIASLPMVWHCALYFRACEAACAGDEQTRLDVFREGVWEDIYKPAFRTGVAGLAALTPTLVLLLLRRPVGLSLPTWAMPASLALSAFLMPSAVLMVVLGDSIGAVSPLNVVRLVAAAPLPYLAVWSALVVDAVVVVAVGWLTWTLAARSLALSVPGLYLALLVLSAAGLVAGRTIGLLYRHYKAKLPFGAE